MIKQIQLRNFKGFLDQIIKFEDFSVVIGRNNAGKSSAFEALRIVSNVVANFKVGKFTKRPSWIGDDGVGIVLASDIQSKPETLFYRYQPPPAYIDVKFANRCVIQIYIGEGGIVYAEAITPRGHDVHSSQRVKECEFPPISILPQIRPLEDYERVLRREYVKKCVDTQLTSRHFRNQIRYFYEHFEDFRNLFEQTWRGIRISEFIDPMAPYDEELSLMLMDEGFVAEVSNFGHGLQMWLQMIWYFARTPSESIVVLDEPDVYMHPEQQERMVGLLRDRFRQTILSTHSKPIIESCEESEILRLHRNLKVSEHGKTQSDYDQEIDRPTLISRISKGSAGQMREDVHHKKHTMESSSHESDIGRKDKERKSLSRKGSEHGVKVSLFSESKIWIWDAKANLVFSMPCCSENDIHELKLVSGRYQIKVRSPDDVCLYVDGAQIDLTPYSGRAQADFEVDIPGGIFSEID